MQIYALLNVGERFAVEFPFMQQLLPQEITDKYKRMFRQLVSVQALTRALAWSALSLKSAQSRRGHQES